MSELFSKGDLVYVVARVSRRARDGSWVEVRCPTLAPNTRRSYGSTAVKRKNEFGEWTKAVRVVPEALFAEETLPSCSATANHVTLKGRKQ